MNNDTEYTYICGKCKQELPRDAFHKHPSGKGHFSICRRCRTYNQDSILGNLLSNARSRAKRAGLPCTIERSDILALNEAQGGKCAYTGILLNWKAFDGGKQRVCPPDRVSLDRIDPKHGYVPGNIQLVTDFMNRIKAWYPEKDVYEFCHLVLNNR